MKPYSLQFLGEPVSGDGYETSRIVIVPVPYEGTVSYGVGTAAGPDALLRASGQVELWDAWSGKHLPHGTTFTIAPIDTFGHYQQVSLKIQDTITQLLHQGKFPVVLGGEHSVSPPAVEAFAAKHPGGVVIHLDAHADLRDDYEGMRHSHACAVRRMLETGVRTLSVGIRSMSWEEAVFAREHNLTILSPEKPGFWDRLKTELERLSGPAWLSFDIDALDPGILPGTGTPEPGGLSWKDSLRILTMLADTGLIFSGLDLVELAPVAGYHHSEFTAAKLLHRLLIMLVHRAAVSPDEAPDITKIT